MKYEGLEGCPNSKGAFLTTTSCNSVQRGTGKQGAGVKIGNGVEPQNLNVMNEASKL